MISGHATGMDPDDYFFSEEFVFPDQGGATGEYGTTCPYCHAALLIFIESLPAVYRCDCCGSDFDFDADSVF